MSAIEPSLLATLIRDSLQQGQTPRLTVSSNSMAPLFRQGDELLLETVTSEGLNPGDVITVAAPAGLLTHRFWAGQSSPHGPQLLTRGDRSLVFDPPWSPELIVGRVVAHIRDDKEMSLTTGWGQKLNRHLGWLAKTEYRLWGPHAASTVPFRPSTGVRLLRKGVYGWATVITALIHLK